MICPCPITIKNPKHDREIDDPYWITVPCGSCPDCLKKRSSQWLFRLQQEQKESISAHFITLTYEDLNLSYSEDGLPNLVKPDFQKFIKRLRKNEAKAHKNKIKYYAVGEYGGNTKRPHYHAIIFNVFNTDNIQLSWDLGHTQIDECNSKTIAYVTNYVMKQKKFHTSIDYRQREFSLMSKGLGLSYLTDKKKEYYKNHLNPYLVIEDGKKLPIPRYYKNKIFTEQELQIINQKSEQHINENRPFKNNNHRKEYIKVQKKIRDKNARKTRKL